MDVEKAIEKNRKQLQKLIKKYGGQKEFVKLLRTFDENVKTQYIHNWLHSDCRCYGLPYIWCILFESLTDGEFSVKNLRHDIPEKIRKALK